MNLTLFGAVALMVFIGDSSCGMGPNFGNFAGMVGGGPFGPGAGIPFGPGAGWAIGQTAQKNVANTVVDNAIFKAGETDLPPELQEELELTIAETQVALAECDNLLLTATVWRYKVCKFHAISQMRLKIQELKLKAAAAALIATTPAPQTFQPVDSSAATNDA